MFTLRKRFGYLFFSLAVGILVPGAVLFTSLITQANAGFIVTSIVDSHDAAPGDGVCMDANGACSLRAALEESNLLVGLDQVTLPAGNYLLSEGELTISDDFLLTGAGAATTIIDGQSTSRVFNITDLTTDEINLTLQGLTVQNGFIDGYGGGIYNYEILVIEQCALINNAAVYGGGMFSGSGGLVTIQDSQISGNAVTEDGGGIRNDAHMTLINTLVAENSAVGSGGGIYASNWLTLVDSTVSGNSAYMGAGVYNDDELTATDSFFLDNQASYRGGGVYNDYGYYPTFTGTTFQGNGATSLGGGLYNYNTIGVSISNTHILSNTASTGGGIYNTGSEVRLVESTLAYNVATSGGGALANSSESNMVVENSTFHDNVTGSSGGVLYNSGSAIIEFYNSTLSGNKANNHGGAIANASGNVLLSQTTVTENTTDYDNNNTGDGGGLWDGTSSGYIQLKGSVIAENSDLSGQGPNCLGEYLYSSDYNLIDDLTGCVLYGQTTHNVTGLSPLLQPLGDNGGLTWTHALMLGSPAINAGICQNIQSIEVIFDQRGMPRPVGADCDMGAFEYPGVFMVKKVDDLFPLPGQIITYTLIMRNVLTNAVSEAVISDTLSDGLTFVGPITLNPPIAGTPGATPPELATHVDLLPSQTLTLTFPVQVNPDVSAGTIISNLATMTGTGLPLPGVGINQFVVCLEQLTVTNLADDGPGSLRHAVFAICPGGTITFSLPSQSVILLTSGEILVDKPMTIQGPGMGDVSVSGNQTSRVFNVSAEGVTISGLTLRDGAVVGKNGGALYNSGTLVLTNTTWISNTASITNLATGGGGGGAIANLGVITISHSAFLSNTVDAYGGGGGGVYNDGQAWVLESYFENNSSTDYYGYGGAIHNAENGTILIERSHFFANWARNSGGALNNFDGELIIRSSVAHENHANEFDGGALNYSGGAGSVSNTTFSNNVADNDGGAIWLSNGYIDLDNVTLVNNSAGLEGQAIFLASGGADLRNTLIAGPPGATNCEGSSVYNIFNSFGYNLSTDGSCDLDAPTDLPNTDPLIGPLANYGGNTLTHALLPGSPAIDHGNCTDLLGTPILTDQRGFVRPIGQDCDLGAFEYDGLSLNKFADQLFAEPGQQITYTITLLNASPISVTAGWLSDTLPASLLFAGPITLIPPDAGNIGTTPPMLVYDLSLAPHQLITVTFPVTVSISTPLSTIITNTVAFTSTSQPEPLMASRAIRVCSNHLTVVSNLDDGPGTLRQAIVALCPGGLIDFNLGTPATILLTSGELHIDKSLTMLGPGPEALIVSGNQIGRVFNITANDVTLQGFTIRDGNTPEHGGGVFSASTGTVNLLEIHFFNNTALNGGGFYNATGTLVLDNSLVLENTASGQGGGGYSQGGLLAITHSTVQENAAGTGGWGVFLRYGQAILTNTAILSNTASAQGAGIYSWGTLTISDSQIDGNRAEGTGSSFEGAGMFLQTGSLTLSNSTVRNNLGKAGAGIYTDSALLTLTTCEISGNISSVGYGGGIHVASPYSIHTLTDCLLEGNTALRGGGIYNISGHLVVSQSQILNNTGEGGGVYNGQEITLIDTLVQGNYAPIINYARSGGGLFNESDGLVTLQHSAILENEATQNGGGIFNIGINLTILSSIISGNMAGGNGGGIVHDPYSGTFLLANSTVSGNMAAGYGGGIFQNALSGSGIHHSTIAGNISDSDGDGTGAGGGIYQAEGTTPTLLNTILADNSDLSGQAPDCGGQEYYSVGYTIVEDLTGCQFTPGVGDILGLDPVLSPLDDHGGDTLTHALLPGSPALNAGTCTNFAGDPVLEDQRGVARPQGLACDIGAFEAENTWFQKTVSDSAPYPGELLTYTLYLENATGETLTGLVISDTLPYGLLFAGPITLNPPGVGIVGIAPPLLAYDLTLVSGQSLTVTFPVTVIMGLPAGTVIVNTATASDPSNEFEQIASATLTVGNAAPIANPDTYTTPQDIVLQVSAPGVLENDQDPNGTLLLAILNTPPAQGELTLNSDGSFMYMPPVGFTGVETFTYYADDGYNTVLTTVSLETYLATTADLALSVTASSETVSPSTWLTYTLSLTNNGPLAATHVILTDTLPVGSSLINVQGVEDCIQTDEAISCTLDILPSGATRQLTITIVAPSAEGWLTNSAEVTATEPDPNPINNFASIQTYVENQFYKTYLPLIYKQ